MNKEHELEYEIRQLKFEKENLKRQLVAAMKLNKKMFEEEVRLKELNATLKKVIDAKEVR